MFPLCLSLQLCTLIIVQMDRDAMTWNKSKRYHILQLLSFLTHLLWTIGAIRQHKSLWWYSLIPHFIRFLLGFKYILLNTTDQSIVTAFYEIDCVFFTAEKKEKELSLSSEHVRKIKISIVKLERLLALSSPTLLQNYGGWQMKNWDLKKKIKLIYNTQFCNYFPQVFPPSYK